MAKVLINDSTLSAIGDAIRYKTNSTDTFKPSEMPSAIKGIIVDGLDFKNFIQGDLTHLHIPYAMSDNGVLKAKPEAFGGFEKLETLTFEDGITSIDNSNEDLVGGDIFSYAGAYVGSVGVDIILPSTLKNIGNCVFENVNFTGLQLPNELETIGKRAFCNQSNVGASASSLTIPASVKTIGEQAFYGAYITKVYFKGTPQSIGRNFIWYNTTLPVTVYCPWEAGKGPTINIQPTNNITFVYGYKE